MAALIIKISNEKEEKGSIIGRGEDGLSRLSFLEATMSNVQPIDGKVKDDCVLIIHIPEHGSTAINSEAPQYRYLAVENIKKKSCLGMAR